MLSKIWNILVSVGAKKESNFLSLDDKNVKNAYEEFSEFFEKDVKGTEKLNTSDKKLEDRQKGYATMVNHYYDLVTDFYEYGWGHCFHFAPRFKGETFHASIARHEYWLASKLRLAQGEKVLDVGCGIGGPMRNIARFSGSKIIGINNNAYQVKRSDVLTKVQRLENLCATVKGDFMKLPFQENTFDKVYAIEATCHAPDKEGCYSQVFKVLKPGGYFGGYEWCVTDKYDKNNEKHKAIKYMIEKGDSLPDLVTVSVVIENLKKAGFEIIEYSDRHHTATAEGSNVPWYQTFQTFSVSNMKHSKVGRFFTQKLVDALSIVKIAPKGTAELHSMLSKTCDALEDGGKLDIFSPMIFFLARKPLKKKNN